MHDANRTPSAIWLIMMMRQWQHNTCSCRAEGMLMPCDWDQRLPGSPCWWVSCAVAVLAGPKRQLVGVPGLWLRHGCVSKLWRATHALQVTLQPVFQVRHPATCSLHQGNTVGAPVIVAV